ncbi:MAG: DUF429 domain-containing protein [Fimbriimonadaceae bacterium]|nr:DUF429 domain-containing protein [Fimbriimonadaceae bacterium]QYK59661.1 MAG: DUF429 domain-containing protein [Fimbriimonadaceae bacterium]
MVIGADGCRCGWFGVWEDPRAGLVGRIFPTVRELFSGPWSVIAIDIPIGLRGCGDPRAGAPRMADTAARAMLPPKRKSSVFPAPLREAIRIKTRAEADEVSRSVIGKGVSAQAFGIYGKVQEVDEALQLEPSLRKRVFEVHPEVSFALMNGGRGIAESKRGVPGRAQRSSLLGRALEVSDTVALLRRNLRKTDVADDDILDACAALVTAKRIVAGEARSFPDPPEVDSLGLRMAIWA